jgi:hypothetical protein
MTVEIIRGARELTARARAVVLVKGSMDVSKWPWKKWFLSAATATAAGGVVITCNSDSETNACNNDASDFSPTVAADASADATRDGTTPTRVDAGTRDDAAVTDASSNDADVASPQDAADDGSD